MRDHTSLIPSGSGDERLHAALRYCDRVASKGTNNLWKAAQSLEDGARYRLFVSTYAAMRVIDDAVDVGFLGKPEKERDRGRDEALRLVGRWLSQAEAAAAGAYSSAEDSMEPLVFEALNEYLPRSEIGIEPWTRLARSMTRDVREEGLATWNDFLDYCEGASVAPASIFIYILACQVGEGDRTFLRLPRPAEAYARDMALFCYLVHILRDLADDVRGNRQLVTIPFDVLSRAGLEVDGLARALQGGEWQRLAPVTRYLIDEARSYAARAESMMAALAPHMPAAGDRILRTLFHWYMGTFREVQERYLRNSPASA